MNKNEKMLVISAIAVLATMMVATSNVSTSDVFATKKYDRSNAQSGVEINDCIPATDVGNGFQPTDISGNTVAHCIGDNVQNQDSDGTAIESNPSASSDSSQGSIEVP